MTSFQDFVRAGMDQQRRMDAERRARIEAMPRVRLVCGRDWCGPDRWEIGALWGLNPDAGEGEFVYRHRWILKVMFHCWVSKA